MRTDLTLNFARAVLAHVAANLSFVSAIWQSMNILTQTIKSSQTSEPCNAYLFIKNLTVHECFDFKQFSTAVAWLQPKEISLFREYYEYISTQNKTIDKLQIYSCHQRFETRKSNYFLRRLWNFMINKMRKSAHVDLREF